MSNVPMTSIEAGLTGSNESSTMRSRRPDWSNPILSFDWIRTLFNSVGTSAPNSRPDASREADDENFIYRHEYKQYPRGWALLAAEQDAAENLAIHRKFGYLGQRCLIHWEEKLTGMEKELHDLDCQIANEGQFQHQPEPGRSNSEANEDPDNRHEVARLVERISSVLGHYHQALFNEKVIRSLYEVGDTEHRGRYGKVKADGYLSQEEMRFLCFANDFVSTRPDRLKLSFETLLHRFPGSFFTKMLMERGGRKERYAKVLSSTLVSAVFSVILIWCCAVLLLLPVVLLYFIPNLSAEAAAIIAIIASVAFTGTMVCLQVLPTETILLGLSTYLAVLVAFMTSLQERETKA